ncbi:MAG: porin family protein [Bermanella sp.]
MNKTTLISALAATLFTLSAQAEQYYMEASVGSTNLETGSASESDTSFSILGGYDVYDQDKIKLAAEIGYNQYAELSSTDDFFGQQVTTTQDISSLAFGAKLAYTPMAKLDVFGRLAYETMKNDVESDGFGSLSATSDEITYALGASYEVVDNFALGTQYKYASLDGGSDLTNITVSANYHF